MSYREQRCIVSLMVASFVAAVGCGTDDSSGDDIEGPKQEFRCRIAKPDGTCESMPANCPVTLPITLDEPHCPLGAELIPISDDDCARKFICID